MIEDAPRSGLIEADLILVKRSKKHYSRPHYAGQTDPAFFYSFLLDIFRIASSSCCCECFPYILSVISGEE